MAARSRFQLVNRGSNARPWWCVVDAQGAAHWQAGPTIYSNNSRSKAESYLKMMRRLDKERAAKLAAGFHLPGL